jgi:hypothetical protein
MSTYSKSIGANAPTMFMILLDQSGSMDERYAGLDKQTVAAQAVNKVIAEIIGRSYKGEKISDRCWVGVIGYGGKVDLLIGGMVSQVNDNPIDRLSVKKKVYDGAGGLVEVDEEMPVWVTPMATNGTPMGEAFAKAYDIIQDWVGNNPDTFPPIVINITDGQPNDAQMVRDNALKIMQLSTTDGNVLVFNAHIQETNDQEIKLPSSVSGISDQYARFLFEISSVLPESLVAAAEKVGFSPQPGARGFVYKAGVESLIGLLNFGSTQVLR